MNTFITAFSEFPGKIYDPNYRKIIDFIRNSNSKFMDEVVDASSILSSFLSNTELLDQFHYNPNLPFHKYIVGTDYFRLDYIRNHTSNENKYGWIDADLILTDPPDLSIPLGSVGVCNVITKRKSDYQSDLSNGIIITDNKEFLTEWITLFNNGTDSVDFSEYSRGIINKLMNKYDIRSIGDVISFSSYHNTDNEDDLIYLKSKCTKLIGYNLSLSWNPEKLSMISNQIGLKYE